MVINTDKKFIFVHIPKTAGTSITSGIKSLRGNHTHWLGNTKHETLAELRNRVTNRYTLFDKIVGRNPENYFIFGFSRNPWDRMASLHRYLVEKRPRPEINAAATFREFLIKANNGCEWIQSLRSMRPQVDYITLPNGNKKIDFLGHFEYLHEDVKTVADKLDILLELKHVNGSSNQKNDYRQYYDDEMAEIVGRIFKEDCHFFGYQFDTPFPAKRISGAVDEVKPQHLEKNTGHNMRELYMQTQHR